MNRFLCIFLVSVAAFFTPDARAQLMRCPQGGLQGTWELVDRRADTVFVMLPTLANEISPFSAPLETLTLAADSTFQTSFTATEGRYALTERPCRITLIAAGKGGKRRALDVLYAEEGRLILRTTDTKPPMLELYRRPEGGHYAVPAPR